MPTYDEDDFATPTLDTIRRDITKVKQWIEDAENDLCNLDPVERRRGRTKILMAHLTLSRLEFAESVMGLRAVRDEVTR